MEDALPAAALVRARGARTAVDVGSGGGSPGIPVAVAAGIPVTLLEATGTKAGFLREVAAVLELPCDVVHERSEAYARGAGRDAFDVALARALAPPPVAVELCLPLVRPGGALLLLAGDADERAVAAAAGEVAGRLVRRHPGEGRRGMLEIAKAGATPARFPRRPGAAGKRPLGSVRSPP